ncbi:MAG: ABC transporter permease [Acidimicrobiales bacterium]|jgi:peptide/nickel transport system permease protein|nr:ABC transporter permease [Acidimicrobiales bacterium]GIS98843.1 MAG: ABC transporter permease [Acidimicrobiales bacterium]|tara:strand:- start:581 stop:1456 length:876 start_codon:yes stop_codon:yes gene_type:complete
MTDVGVAIEQVETGGRGALRMFLRNKAAAVGLVIFSLIVLVTIFGPGLYGTSANKMVSRPFLGPGSELAPPLGTDYLGRDILAGIIGGGRATLIVAAVAAAMTMTIGIVVGSLAGYFGGWIDALLMRFTEVFQVMPGLLFSMVVIFLLGPGTRNETLAIGLTLWPLAARLARAEFLRLREMEYVKAARAIGCGDLRIMFRTILPNAMPPLLVSATLTVVIAILFHSGLAFLGMVDVNTISWGSMLGKNRGYALTAWWMVFFPGIAIVVTGLSISLVGDGLQDAFNPKLRGR